MITLSILISNSEVNGPGGLFDIDATLPLVIIQFILIAIILNPILFQPLVNVINKRDDYVSETVNEASDLLLSADILTTEYENRLDTVKKETQLEITKSQEIHKEIFDVILRMSQYNIDLLLSDISNDLLVKKKFAFNHLSDVVKSLCFELEKRLQYSEML